MPRWMLIARAIALIGTGLLIAMPPPGGGSFSTWPRERGTVNTLLESQKTVDNLTEAVVTYPSLNGRGRAVLWIPNRTNATALPPVVVHMTGRTVPAEGAENLAKFLGSLGVATLSVEKRGGDRDLTPEKARIWVWDLLRGFDLLRAPLPRDLRAAVDPERIAVSGDSIGANLALVAASVEPRFKGALAFSGFLDNQFGTDLDPSVAVSRISDRPVAFFHARDDPVAPFEQGRALFDRAREPKFFYAINGTRHGYGPEMFPQIEEQVRRLFSLPTPSPTPQTP